MLYIYKHGCYCINNKIMTRLTNIQTYKHRKIYKCTILQVYKHTNLQIYNHTNIQNFKHTDEMPNGS